MRSAESLQKWNGLEGIGRHLQSLLPHPRRKCCHGLNHQNPALEGGFIVPPIGILQQTEHVSDSFPRGEWGGTRFVKEGP